MFTSDHNIWHSHTLVADRIPISLRFYCQRSKNFNFIQAWPSNYRIFYLLCNDTGSEYRILISHTEFLWLYLGDVLRWLFQLRKEMTILFVWNRNIIIQVFSRRFLVQLLEYLQPVSARPPLNNACSRGHRPQWNIS